MPNKPLVSIIVPAYNAIDYIDSCIKGVLAQTYDNIEVIVVNDGSTDETADYCAKINKPGVKIVNKKNGGLSSARNAGLSVANGEYIFFLDSDDEIYSDTIEKLAEIAIEMKADIVSSVFCSKKELLGGSKGEPIVRELSKKEALKKISDTREDFAPNVCNKLFKRELFVGNLFPEGRLFEDMIVMVTAVMKASNKIIETNNYCYYYQTRDGSITQSYNPKEYDHIVMSNLVLEKVKSDFPSETNNYISYHAVNQLSVINKMASCGLYDKDIAKDYRRFVFRNPVIFLSENMSISKKIQIICSSVATPLYAKCFKVIKK
ncbi:glycosyltransferase family 2 protein [Candidatus Saccharibacteria bacterium]|nr:glycosyltransferase family 2 protein [Candidatus Saccharibacteria bacterium]